MEKQKGVLGWHNLKGSRNFVEGIFCALVQKFHSYFWITFWAKHILMQTAF